MRRMLAAVGAAFILLLASCSCSEDEAPPGNGLDGEGGGNDGATIDLYEFKDAPPDKLLLPDWMLDQAKLDKWYTGDGGDPCQQWSNWYCEGQYPDYKAVCPPGANPKRIMRCVLNGFCYCEVVGVSPEKPCFYTPVPVGGKICSAFEQAFKKGCCKP